MDRPVISIPRQVFAWRGWVSAAIIFPAITVATLSEPLVRADAWADPLFDVLGWCLLSTGVFVRLWATLYIGGHKSITLIVTGPYAACRHPLYVGSFFILLALAVFLKSPTVLVALILVSTLYALVLVASEEAHALVCFGEAYQEYARQTPRFLPRLARLSRPGLVQIKVAAVLREFARAFGCILVAAATQLCAHARLEPWWPKLFNLP